MVSLVVLVLVVVQVVAAVVVPVAAMPPSLTVFLWKVFLMHAPPLSRPSLQQSRDSGPCGITTEMLLRGRPVRGRRRLCVGCKGSGSG